MKDEEFVFFSSEFIDMKQEIKTEEFSFFSAEFIAMIYEWIKIIKEHFPEVNAELLISLVINDFKKGGNLNRERPRSVWAKHILKALSFVLGVEK